MNDSPENSNAIPDSTPDTSTPTPETEQGVTLEPDDASRAETRLTGIHRLSAEQQRLVCQRIGEFESNEDILKELAGLGVVIASSAITHYRTAEHWQDEIIRARAAFRANVKDIPLSNSSYRLGLLQRRVDYILTHSDTASKAVWNEVRAIIDQAQREVGTDGAGVPVIPLILPAGIAAAMEYEPATEALPTGAGTNGA